MRNKMRTLWTSATRRRSERGATATEYGLLVGFIAFAIITGATALGVNLNDAYDGWAAVVATF